MAIAFGPQDGATWHRLAGEFFVANEPHQSCFVVHKEVSIETVGIVAPSFDSVSCLGQPADIVIQLIFAFPFAEDAPKPGCWQVSTFGMAECIAVWADNFARFERFHSLQILPRLTGQS